MSSAQNPTGTVTGTAEVFDRATVEQVNKLLAQTGERERLKDMLRSKLVECGWADQVQTECFNEIKSKGVQNISPQELYENMSVKAKAIIPENIKRDVLQEIARFLDLNLP